MMGTMETDSGTTARSEDTHKAGAARVRWGNNEDR